MGTTLTGKNISTTYLGLLKTTDNAVIGSTAKRLTDGSGTDSPLFLSTSKLGIGVTPSVKLHVQESDVSVTPNAEHLLVVEKDGNSGIGIYSGSTSQGSLDFGDSSDANAGRILYTHNDNAMSFSTNGSAKMTIASTGQTKLNNYGSGTFTGTVTQRLGVTSAGQVVEIPIGGGAVDGSGTAGKITKWTDSDTIGDSIMSESGSTISIVDTLKINATTGDSLLQFNITGDTYSMGIDNSDEDKFKLSYGVFENTDLLTIDVDGNSIFSGRLTINKESSSALTISNPSATNDYLLIGHDASLNSLYTSRAENSYGTHTFRQWDGSTTRNILTLDASQNATFEGRVTIGTVDNATDGHLNIGEASPTIQLFDTTNDVKLLIYTQDNNSIIGTYSNHPMAFYTDSGLTLTLNTDHSATFAGSVGIGGKSPAYGLSLAQGSGVNNKIAWTDSTATFSASIYANSSNDKLTFATKNASNAETTALEIDISQNATFAGNIEADVASGGGITIDSADVGTLKFRGGGGTNDWGFASTNLGAGDFGIYMSNAGGGDPISAGTAKLYFNNTGNVGIGTTSPNIYSLTDATNILSVQATGTNKGGIIDISASGTGYSGINLGNETIRRGGIYTLDGSNLVFYTNATNSGTSLSERMRITSAGAIEIKGSSTTANAQAFITNDNSVLTIGSSVSGSVVNDISFNSPSTMMYIDGSTANVGIGTATPDKKLHVAGGNNNVQAWLGDTGYTRADMRLGGDNAAGGRLYFQYNGDSSYIDSYGGHGSTARYRDFQIASRNLKLTTGSASQSDVMYIKSDGTVGIGTTNPQALFNLSQANGANIRFDNPTTSKYFTIGEGVGTAGVFSFRGNSYQSTDTLSVDFVNDRVGVGVIAPIVPFHVVGTAVNNPSNAGGGYEVMQVFDNTSANTGVGGGIGLGGKFNSSGTDTIFSEIRGIKENSIDSNYAGALTFSTRTNGANITERVRISSDGKVGIRCIPTNILHVNADAGSGSALSVFNNTNSDGYGVSIGVSQTTGNKYIFEGTSGGTTRFLVTASGSVGIGETSSTYKLRVKSDATLENGAYISAGDSSSNHALYVEKEDGSAELLAVRGDGEIRLNSTSGHTYAAQGIRLGANAASNNLDDYEEGTWTPTIQDLGSNAATLSTANGTYTKIGRLVVVNYNVQLSSKGSMTGNYVHLGGLPFNHPTTDNGTGIIDKFNNMASNMSSLTWDTTSTAGVCWLMGVVGTEATSSSYITVAQISDTTKLKGTIIYHT